MRTLESSTGQPVPSPFEDWNQEDRRSAHSERIKAMVQIAVTEAMATHKAEMLEHIDAKFSQLDALIRSAFPGGDPIGHRMAHESQIKATEFWWRIKSSLMEKLAAGIVSGALLFAAMAVWESIKAKLVSK